MGGADDQFKPARLRCQIVAAQSLSPEAVEEIREIVRSHLDIGREELLEQIARQRRVWLFRDRRGRLEVFFMGNEYPVQIEGSPVLLVALSTFYARHTARGSPVVALAALRYICGLALRHPRARKVAISGVSEDSWLWYRKTLKSVWTPQHPDLPHFYRQVIKEACHRFPFWDSDRQTFRLPWCRGPSAPPRPLGSASRSALLAEFAALLPSRTSNEHLLLVADLSISNALPGLRLLLRRAARS